MKLAQATKRAKEVRVLFEAFEEQRYGRSWTTQELFLGFIGDIGDLSKLIQGKAGVRDTVNLDDKIRHEFADCLWSLLVLADRCDVDLADAFTETMNSLETVLHEKLDA